MKHRYTALALTSALLAAGATGASTGVPPQAYARVNAALIEHHVLPRYARLEAAAAALARAARRRCEHGDALDGARAAWHQAADGWMGVEHLRFGPVELFMRGHRVHFWPEALGRIPGAVEEALAAERPLREASVAVQGLPAAEHLLFEGEPPRPGTDRCRLLVAIAANLHDIASGILADWRGGEVDFAAAVRAPGTDNPWFATHRDAALAFFKSLYGGLQRVADVKLKPALGDSARAARPQLLESRPSARALRNVILDLEALEALYGGEGGPGLGDLAREHGADAKLDALLRKAFRVTLATARGIELPLEPALTDPRARAEVEKLATQVQALKQIVRTRLAAALGLQVGFNALDGD